MKPANNSVKERLKALPKVEVHLHLDGSLSPELILQLSQEMGHAPLASLTVEEIAKKTVVDTPWPNLAAVLEVFRLLDPILKSKHAIRTSAYHLCRKANEQNLRYIEVRFAPMLFCTEQFSPDDVIAAALEGLKDGHKDYNVQSALILCMLRDQSPKANETTLELAKKFKGKGVVALDLANDEQAHPLTEFKQYYQEAIRAGLNTTVHAGEVYPTKDFPMLLDLGIGRIGHGTHLLRYKDELKEVAKRKIPIEINLTSNLRTGTIRSLKEHPAHDYLELGIPIVFSTDDPGVFATDINQEYWLAHQEAGFSEKELQDLALQSTQALFLSDKEKSKLAVQMRNNLS